MEKQSQTMVIVMVVVVAAIAATVGVYFILEDPFGDDGGSGGKSVQSHVDLEITADRKTAGRGQTINLTIKVTNGMRTGAMPGRGDRGCFSTIPPPTRYPQTVPDTVPWTHVLPLPPIADGEIA